MFSSERYLDTHGSGISNMFFWWTQSSFTITKHEKMNACNIDRDRQTNEEGDIVGSVFKGTHAGGGAEGDGLP